MKRSRVIVIVAGAVLVILLGIMLHDKAARELCHNELGGIGADGKPIPGFYNDCIDAKTLLFK
jgi:hypothetical protein